MCDMKKSTKDGYQRVSRGNPCPICGKSDWCLVAKDGSAAICPRISQGAVRYIQEAGYLHRFNDYRGYLRRIKKRKTKKKMVKKLKAKKRRKVLRPTRKFFEYTDEKGNKLFRVVRVDHPSKPKKIWQERFINGKWKRGTTDPRTKESLVHKTLYNQLQLLDPKRSKEVVHLPEGENKVEVFLKMGFLATCNPGGAGKWCDEYSKLLKDRDVVIFSDNDWPGKKHSRQIRDSLLGKAKSIRIVELPGLPESGDIIDWLRGFSNLRIAAKRLRKLIKETEPVKEHLVGDQPILVKMSSFESEKTDWLWENRIALGEINIIAGNPGLGKSFATLSIAAKISLGSPMPDSRLRRKKHSVILLSAEDHPAKTIRPRLDAMEADTTRISLLKSVQPYNEDEEPSDEERLFRLSEDMKVLEKALKKESDCQLIIIDPVNAYLGKTDSYKDSEVRSILAPLAELAARYNIAIIIVMHLRKSESSEPLYRVIGSIGFVAAARIVWQVVKDPEDESRRLFLPAKNNLAPMEDIGMAYSICDNAVEWESGPVDMTLQEVFLRDSKGREKSTAKNEAVDWIIEALSDGPVLAKEMQRMAKDSGHNWRTVNRAKDIAGAESKRLGFGKDAVWYWKLIDDERKLPTPK
ncbi:MAG: AAA family ATPase [Planctomycetes bacterium]|nr:AAA family ATPase [Planctomycetota bacterium]